ncbi:MAG: hypothetical protein GXO79_10045 [Chlorobi bacterium]|nr:hypothetical protein [Chlorobiota bacterium]
MNKRSLKILLISFCLITCGVQTHTEAQNISITLGYSFANYSISENKTDIRDKKEADFTKNLTLIPFPYKKQKKEIQNTNKNRNINNYMAIIYLIIASTQIL